MKNTRTIIFIRTGAVDWAVFLQPPFFAPFFPHLLPLRYRCAL